MTINQEAKVKLLNKVTGNYYKKKVLQNKLLSKKKMQCQINK